MKITNPNYPSFSAKILKFYDTDENLNKTFAYVYYNGLRIYTHEMAYYETHKVFEKCDTNWLRIIELNATYPIHKIFSELGVCERTSIPWLGENCEKKFTTYDSKMSPHEALIAYSYSHIAKGYDNAYIDMYRNALRNKGLSVPVSM